MNWGFITRFLIVIVGIILLGSFGTRSLRNGPLLHNLEPTDGTAHDTSYIEIRGTGERLAEVFIDDVRVLPTIEGDFTHGLLLSPGINTITVRILDKFEKEKVYTRTLWGNFDEHDYDELLRATKSSAPDAETTQDEGADIATDEETLFPTISTPEMELEDF